jgi:DNA-binding NtrC family response regulator
VGTRVLARIRQFRIEDMGMERIPVVLVSGIVGLTDVARRVGTPYFMGKPFDLDKLLGMLERALKEKRPPVPVWNAKPA